MSGTKAHSNLVSGNADAFPAIAAALNARASAVASNRAAVKDLLVGVVKSATGWGNIDDWAMTAIEQAMAGTIVDIKELEAAVTQWKAAQTTEE